MNLRVKLNVEWPFVNKYHHINKIVIEKSSVYGITSVIVILRNALSKHSSIRQIPNRMVSRF